MGSITVGKVLNNNVIIAQHPQYAEVVVIGKGIGYNRKSRDQISLSSVEKMFILRSQEEQEQYKQLVPQVDEKLIEVVQEIVLHIMQSSNQPLNEHIHIALTDHISFAIRRSDQNIAIHNPFLYETKEIYPEEYRLAEYAVRRINETMAVTLPPDEIGFVALHIVSALSNRHISEVREHSLLIGDLVAIVEDNLDYRIPRDSLDYSRLVTHLRFVLERLRRGETVRETSSLDDLMKREYPEMYSLSWKLTKIIEQRVRIPVYPAEVSYLTIHLQRLAQKKEDEADMEQER
ncbi:PtsGHI operon antiterminator [Paenibacillus sp. FSL R7-0273]|uniref:glucose PTS transporter transcription antiterminator GlcT n=1 Tax=Paenibacillus sp. FSL R7-0273 TaxID=1536772 RepID=UPI0004F6C55D|nr:PRD domain-containing protein [Paenibacillus sp. FSL R7-0273]AIQ46037.1 PtsGHI operon antiterminator [Paenibacillus sp. FSL R7-0273]OMF92836.1 PtsGHI operon antiterminator [Paenibacillus sp. FSL R7-0273]